MKETLLPILFLPISSYGFCLFSISIDSLYFSSSPSLPPPLKSLLSHWDYGSIFIIGFYFCCFPNTSPKLEPSFLKPITGFPFHFQSKHFRQPSSQAHPGHLFSPGFILHLLIPSIPASCGLPTFSYMI